MANEALRRSEETAELLAEKSRVAEEEAMLLSQKATEAEQELTRMKLTAMKTEEEKMTLEKKTREAEQLTARLVDESERRAYEANRLKDELLRARMAEKEAKEKLLEFISRNTYMNGSSNSLYHGGPPLDVQPLPLESQAMLSTADLTSYELAPEGDIVQLSLEIEKERVDYIEKSKHLQNQLRDLKSEIEVLKIEEKQCELDLLHDEQVKLGETKYSTLRKVRSGSTKARVAFFEEL